MEVKILSVTKKFAVRHHGRNPFKAFLWASSQNWRNVFTNFDLTIESSKKVLIVGRNGSGKTTLLKLIGGYLRPDAGEVFLDGRATSSLPRTSVGAMFSLALLYRKLSGYQNLEYSAHLYGVSQVGSRLNYLSDVWGIRDFWDHPVSSYSNGMMARLALARATLHDPAVLLLDEPAAYLDSIGFQQLQKFLRVSHQTILITAPQPNVLADYVDEVVLLP